MKRHVWFLLVWFLLVTLVVAGLPLLGLAQEGSADESLLTLDRIFDGREFQTAGVDARWLADGSGYTVLRDAQAGGAKSSATACRVKRLWWKSPQRAWCPLAKIDL